MGGVVNAVVNNPLASAVMGGAQQLPIVGDVIGAATGAKQFNQYQAQAPQVLTPVTGAQANEAQQASLDALAQQQNLANALAAQGGIGNQADILKQQQALASQLQGQSTDKTGVQNQADILKQQQSLANQLQSQSLGQGPNPAQEQYKQNVNAGTQAAAGTISSQKGISPALAAELMARQQGSANQNAAGSAAVLQAQQQLAAQQQLGAQQAAMQGIAQNQIGQRQASQQLLQGQQAGMQGLAQNQINQQVAGATGLTSAQQQQQQMLLNSLAGINTTSVDAQKAALNANAATAASNAGIRAQILGGLVNAGGSLAGKAAMGAKGGMVEEKAITPVKGSGKQASMHEMPSHLVFMSDLYHGPVAKMAEGGNVKFDQKESKSTSLKIPAKQQMMADGGTCSYKDGAMVPGKAKVDHNSYTNDTVKALLSPGEVVIPLDVMNSKDPVSGAAKFVKALLDKKENSSSDKDDFHKALKDAIGKRRKK